jgi:hypothetical protein
VPTGRRFVVSVMDVSQQGADAGHEEGVTRARSRTLFAVTALLAVLAVLPVGGAVAGSDDPTGDQYRAYASVREKLVACSLDRQWRHLGADARKRCVRLRKLYILWSDPRYSSNSYHVYCRTARKCPAAPDGEPDPRAPIPRGANVFR